MNDYVVWNVRRGRTVAERLTYAQATKLADDCERDEAAPHIIFRDLNANKGICHAASR